MNTFTLTPLSQLPTAQPRDDYSAVAPLPESPTILPLNMIPDAPFPTERCGLHGREFFNLNGDVRTNCPVCHQQAIVAKIAVHRRAEATQGILTPYSDTPAPRFFTPSMLEEQELMRRDEVANEANPLPDWSWWGVWTAVACVVSCLVSALVVIWKASGK